MKIEFTDEQIKEMADAIAVVESLGELTPASPAYVVCRSGEETDPRSLNSYRPGHTQYVPMIKPIVDEYRATCLEASRKALIDIKCMFRAMADGEKV